MSLLPVRTGFKEGSITTLATGSDGDLGYEIGTFELKIALEDGSIIVETGKFTELLRRDTEGKWVSIYGMWNANAPAAE